MHLDTIQHLRSLAGRHADLVPIAKPLLLDLLDSYERQQDTQTLVSELQIKCEANARTLAATMQSHGMVLYDGPDGRRVITTAHAQTLLELAQLREAGTPACPVFPLITGHCGGNWCVWASNKTDAYLWAFDPSQQRAIDGFVATLNTHVLQPPAAPDALNLVILQQLLRADDYDSIEAVKAAAQDYLHSLNACPLDFAHQPHDHCDGTAASQRHAPQPVNEVTPVNPVSESALELVHADMQGHVYGTDVGMNECAADDFLTWYQHFKNHDLGGSKVHEFDIHSVIDIMAEWLKAPFNLELPLAPRPRKYLIISEERRAYGMVWFYAPKSAGYTACTARAGRYTEDEAAAILRGTSGELAVILESDLPKLQILHHIDRGYGDNGAILKTLITHVLPERHHVNEVTPVNPVTSPQPADDTRHTIPHCPGHPCPVDGDVQVLAFDGRDWFGPFAASTFDWSANRVHSLGANIIGWAPALPSQQIDIGSVSETFEAHGHTWTRHTPGDPCPETNRRLIAILQRRGPAAGWAPAWHWKWEQLPNFPQFEIIGWRYAEPQPSTPDK